MISRSIPTWTLALALVAFAASASSLACGPSFVVDGKVVSCADKTPIPGAHITTAFSSAGGRPSLDGQQEQTKPNGEFHIGALSVPKDTTAKVRVESDGYEPTDVVYNGSPDGEQTVCLEKKR
jgi:hypothetical protein